MIRRLLRARQPVTPPRGEALTVPPRRSTREHSSATARVSPRRLSGRPASVGPLLSRFFTEAAPGKCPDPERRRRFVMGFLTFEGLLPPQPIPPDPSADDPRGRRPVRKCPRRMPRAGGSGGDTIDPAEASPRGGVRGNTAKKGGRVPGRETRVVSCSRLHPAVRKEPRSGLPAVHCGPIRPATGYPTAR